MMAFPDKGGRRLRFEAALRQNRRVHKTGPHGPWDWWCKKYIIPPL
jgi:hypothetical protein